MLGYNFAGEGAMFAILAVSFISFFSNYKQNTALNLILKANYVVALLSIIFSILRGVATTGNLPGDSLIFSYVVATIYYILVPSFITGYLLFCTILTEPNLTSKQIICKLSVCLRPHGFYVILLIWNIVNGSVFTITNELGYRRGEWFQLPYYFAVAVIYMILMMLYSNRQNMNKSTVRVGVYSMLLTFGALYMQFKYPGLITPVAMNVMSVLTIHMLLQNSRKSVHGKTGANNFLALKYNMKNMIRKDEDFSLYIISIRAFKAINERNGFKFGDAVLQLITNQLFDRFNYEQVYRYKGDEFALLLRSHPKNDERVQEVLTYLRQPLTIVEKDDLTLQIVCARIDNKLFGSTDNELLSAAEYSVTILKDPHSESDYLHDTIVVKEIIGKNKMIQQIKHAIDNRMFQLCYQPMYSAKDGCFTQAEALVRMKGEDGGIIFPNEFIELAESTDLIIPMTYVILDIVCEDLRRLIDRYGDDLLLEAISVNFPYDIFLNPNMEEKIMNTLNKYRIPTNRIKIEITERTLIADNNTMTNIMQNMLDDGFVFELDDFGVDYSNVNTLLELPLNIIKIDRSVLLSAMNSTANRSFFKHLTAGISATGRTIIVEGVEDKEQLDFVLDSNCEYVQGYIFSKPLTFDTFTDFLLPKQQEKLLSKTL